MLRLAAVSVREKDGVCYLPNTSPIGVGAVAEQETLTDLCNQYASGQLDNSEATPA